MQKSERRPGKPTSVSLRYRTKRSILIVLVLLAIGLPDLVGGLEDGDRKRLQQSYFTLLVAFLFVTWTDRVRVEPASDRVTRKRGFLIPLMSDSYTTSDYERIELRERGKHVGEGGITYFYDIILAGKKT